MNFSTKFFGKALLVLLFGLNMVQFTNAQVVAIGVDSTFIKDKDQANHASWRKGKHPFPGRPRDMWQLGVGGGSFLISGDVKSQFGWGASIHARKSFGYVFSLKMEYMFGQARGLNYQASDGGSYPQIAPFPITRDGNTLITPGQYGLSDPFYMNYKMGQYHAASIQGVFNLNNIRFHRPDNKWSLNWLLGIGVAAYNTRYDALDGNGNPYDFHHVADNLDPTVLADRKTIRDNVKGVLDGKYETLALQNRRNLLWAGKKPNGSMTILPFVSTGLSLEYLVTPRLSIALEHQVFFMADDYMDGYMRQVQGVLTSNTDIPHYTSLRINFHLGNKTKRIQPLWFVNPLVYPMKDIENLKEKLDDDWFKDDDKDGVPNKLDQEKETAPDAIVDTKGRTKDSDGDGVPDHKDKEPFSPPGYPADVDGIAQVPKPIYPSDIKPNGNKLVIGNETYEPIMKCEDFAKCDGVGMGGPGGMKDWYLPMINFDLDKYTLRPEAYSQLQHVANVMQRYPNLKVVAHGHTDVRDTDEYNDILSYNRVMSALDYLEQQYKIDKSRFIIRYNGKKTNLITSAKAETEHFMNRRVEFYVAKPEDKSQERPKDGGRKRNWKY